MVYTSSYYIEYYLIIIRDFEDFWKEWIVTESSRV